MSGWEERENGGPLMSGRDSWKPSLTPRCYFTLLSKRRRRSEGEGFLHSVFKHSRQLALVDFWSEAFGDSTTTFGGFLGVAKSSTIEVGADTYRAPFSCTNRMRLQSRVCLAPVSLAEVACSPRLRLSRSSNEL